MVQQMQERGFARAQKAGQDGGGNQTHGAIQNSAGGECTGLFKMHRLQKTDKRQAGCDWLTSCLCPLPVHADGKILETLKSRASNS
jgi:hypothetical protein